MLTFDLVILLDNNFGYQKNYITYAELNMLLHDEMSFVSYKSIFPKILLVTLIYKSQPTPSLVGLLKLYEPIGGPAACIYQCQ